MAAGILRRHGIAAGARVAVPGCGRGDDLTVWAGAGFAVTGFDAAPAAVGEARRLVALAGVRAEVLRRDVLGLDREFQDRFDVVHDRGCLAALPAHLCRAYARNVHAVLRPGGLYLLALLPAGGGPSPALDREALRELWDRRLEPASPAGAGSWLLWRRPRS